MDVLLLKLIRTTENHVNIINSRVCEEQMKMNKMNSRKEEEEVRLLDHNHEPTARRKIVGLRTMPFIIVNESLEKVASYGLMPNMIFYLMENYHMEVASGTTLLLIWSSISNALAIFGAFLSDSYLGRFSVIALGSFSSFLGMTLLWLTAALPQLKPSPCDDFNSNCNSPTSAQFAVLFVSFALISIGSGCVRPCSIAFGADQLDNQANPDNERVLESFFNWYYASTGISTVLAFTVIVYIQDHLGWQIGFIIPAILMACSVFMFLVGSSLYVKVEAGKSLFTGFIQVLVASFRNRTINLPPDNSDERYYKVHGSQLEAPTDHLRCLNKACIISDHEREVNTEGSGLNPWRQCTIEQVESLKSLLRIIPIWSSGIMLLVTLTLSFTALQAKTMNRHITKTFEIPAGSFNLFIITTLTIWIALYDRILLPLFAKYTRHQHGLSPKARMGIGLLLGVAASATSAMVESVRRHKAVEQGLEDKPEAIVDMSAMWLVPQQLLLGLAEAFNAIGQIEFFYTKFPKSMSSLAMAIYTAGLAVGSLVGSLLVNIVDGVTSNGNNVSWVSSNLNKGHVDYYYGLIGFLNLVNFVYFIFCCRVYGDMDVSNDGKVILADNVGEAESEYRVLASTP